MAIPLFFVRFPLGLVSGLLGSAMIAIVISFLSTLMSFLRRMLFVIGAIKGRQD